MPQLVVRGAVEEGNLMCATIGGMRSSRGSNLMSTNGGTRSSRGGLVSTNRAMRSSNIERKKEYFSSITFGIIAQRRYRASGSTILSSGFHSSKSLARNHSFGL